MAQPGLSIGWPDLRIEVATYLGWSSDSADWDADQIATINRLVNSGIRQYLIPPIVQGVSAYIWSFLRPQDLTITTVADDSSYDLPDDFGGMAGTVLTFGGTGTGFWEIKIDSEERIRTALSLNPSLTGRPQYAAIRPKAFDGSTGQEWEIVFYPTPDQAYSIVGRYTPHFDAPDAENPYLPGGSAHAEGYIASCRAVAEEREEHVGDGPEFRSFIRILTANLSMDQAQMTPDILGRYGDQNAVDGQLMHDRFDTATVSFPDGYY